MSEKNLQKPKQKVFVLFPNLEVVHHKHAGDKGVHISYVTRTNHLSLLLENAVIRGYKRYAFEYTEGLKDSIIDLKTLFDSRNGIDNSGRQYFIEIGFGDGKNSYNIASNNPNINYLCFDVYLQGFAEFMNMLNTNPIDNVLLVRFDAEDFITHSISDNSIDGFNIFFPDPWIKRKQKKRRIINPQFTNVLVQKLKNGGIIHTATDIEEYAYSMLDIFTSNNNLKNKFENFAPASFKRTKTHFEEKGILANRQSFDLVFAKV